MLNGQKLYKPVVVWQQKSMYRTKKKSEPVLNGRMFSNTVLVIDLTCDTELNAH